MSVTLDLSEKVLGRLRAEAERRHLSMDAVVEELAATLPSERTAGVRRRLSFVALGSSVSGRRALDADEMLAGGFGRDAPD